MQTGIADKQNAVRTLLLDGGVRDPGVRPEMLAARIVARYRAGRAAGSRRSDKTPKKKAG